MATDDRTLKILLQIKSDVADLQKVQTGLKEVQTQATAVNTALKSTSATQGSNIIAGNFERAGRAANVLGREITACVVQGQSLETAVSGVGTSLGIAGIVGFGLYQLIAHAADESVRLNGEISKQTESLVKNVGQWIELAKAASDYGNVVKLGQKIEPELQSASAKLAEFRGTELSLWQKFTDLMASQWATIPGWGVKPNQDAIDKAIEDQQRLVDLALRLANANVQAAQRAEEAWARVKLEPLNQAVAEYTQKLDALKAKQSGIDPNASVGSFAEWVKIGQEILTTRGRLDELTKSQTELANQTTRVQDAIRKADFAQMDPQQRVKALSQDISDLIQRLRELGVNATTPLEAMQQATEANRAAVAQLAGAWVSVLVEISRVVAEASKARTAFAATQAVTQAYAYGSRDEIYKAEWGAKYNKILEERKKIGEDISAASINQQIYDDQRAADRKKALAEEDRATGRVVSGHREVTNMLREESALLASLRQQQELVSGDPFSSADAKDEQLHNLYLREQAAILAEIAKVRSKILELENAGKSGDQGEIQRLTKELNDLSFAYAKTEQKIQSGGIVGDLRGWANSFGSTVHQISGLITGTLNTAIGSTSQALTALIFKTGNWKQAFASAAQSIVQNIIQIALQWAISKLIMAALDRVTGQGSSQAAVQAGTQAAEAWAPAAYSASVASYGAAAGLGLLTYGAGILSAQALATGAVAGGGASGGGFAEGGLIPGSPSRTDDRVAAVASGEFIVRSQAVEHYGATLLHAINRMEMPVSRGFAFGGMVDGPRVSEFYHDRSVSAGAGSKTEIHVFNFTDRDALTKAIVGSDAAQKIIVDTVRGRRLDLGIR